MEKSSQAHPVIDKSILASCTTSEPIFKMIWLLRNDNLASIHGVVEYGNVSKAPWIDATLSAKKKAKGEEGIDHRLAEGSYITRSKPVVLC